MRAVLGPVEHIVRRERDQVRILLGDCRSQHSNCRRVDGHGEFGLSFAEIHGSEGCSVDDEIGLIGLHKASKRAGVGEIGIGPAGCDHLVAWKARQQLGADLSTSTDDQNLHDRALSGSHHARLSRYQATVSARASSKERFGSQPSRRTFEVSTE